MEENEFESFMGKLKGKSKKHFIALLEQLGEANDMIEAHEETISNKEGVGVKTGGSRVGGPELCV